jgi:hypothetical protein
VSKREVISSFPKSRHKNEQLQAQALHAKDRASQVTQLCCAIGSAKREKKRTMEYHESVREKEATLAAKYSMASFYMGEEKLN